MQKVLYTSQIEEYSKYLEANIINYLKDGQTETFESFQKFSLISFDWYDVHSEEISVSQIIIYIDHEDLFFFCEDLRSFKKVSTLISGEETNQKALYLFFVGLIKDDMKKLDTLEEEILDTEEAALSNRTLDYLHDIHEYRKELIRLKRYYEHLSTIFDNLIANDNNLFKDDGIRNFSIIGNRIDRFYKNVLNLRDYVTQMREACQAQLDLEQNNLMRTFTVITAVFLPLTLIVGWYGMNFINMPELTWQYGYLAVTILSVLVCAALLIFFKRKKWF